MAMRKSLRVFYPALLSLSAPGARPETEDEFSTGKFVLLDRLPTVIAMVTEDDGYPDRAYPLGRHVSGLLGGVFGGEMGADHLRVLLKTERKEQYSETMGRLPAAGDVVV